MSKYDQLQKKKSIAFSEAKHEIEHINLVAQESRRVADVAHNAEIIIADLDRKFAETTKLNGTDIAFLFAATALQCVRWILLPALDFDVKMTPPSERLTSQQGAQIEQRQKESFLDKHQYDELKTSAWGYFGWNEIIGAPVPYDAMAGSENFAIQNFKPEGKQLYGKNHHVATLGHDPILGWIFGTMDIMCRTATMKDFSCHNVEMCNRAMKENSLIFFQDNRQIITTPTTLPVVIGKCLHSFSEDNKRLFAAVARQGMHFASDAFTKMGLPIPMLNAMRAQNLLEIGWNSVEAEKLIRLIGKDLAVVGAQMGISILINFIVRSLHLLCFDGDLNNQTELDLYEVKTRKILSYSNAIASGSNILYVALSEDVSKLDIGGIIVTIYRLISDHKFIASVKQEFLEKEWSNAVMGDFDSMDFLKE